jgi:glycosyltransferase involved in cell wall biosynthesis
MVIESAVYEVSVCVLTYNHKEFIADALESVMGQKTDFGVEVLVFDDGSTDGTVEVLKDFERQHKGKIKLFLAEKNRGNYQNGLQIVNHATGRYIAFMDGDDKWLYEGKLQKQVEYLQANPDMAGCFHDAAIEIVGAKNDEQQKINWLFEGYRYYSQCYQYTSIYYPWDGLQRKIIPHSSLVVSRERCQQAASEYPKLNLSGSWILQQLMIRGSAFKYFNEVWSLYREHKGGVTKKVDPLKFNLSNIQALRYFLSLKAYAGMRKLIYEAIAHEYKFILYSDTIGAVPLLKRCVYISNYVYYSLMYILREAYHAFIK